MSFHDRQPSLFREEMVKEMAVPRKIWDSTNWMLLLIWVAPFGYRSPDGLELYLLNRWSWEWVLFLVGWTLVCGVAWWGWWIQNRRKAIQVFFLLLFAGYAGLFLISALMWSSKRLSFMRNEGHWIQDAELMARHRPNFHWKGMVTHDQSRSDEDRVISIDLDEEGFRNPPPPPEKIDIAFLGDSFTFGGQVNQDELFTSILSKNLGVTGRNYGIAGIGHGTELGVLKKYALKRKPRVVVIQVFDNDPADDYWYYQWLIQKRTPGENENWIMGRTDAVKDYPWSSVFTLKMPAGLIQNLVLRATDRSQGFLVQLPGKTVHFFMRPWPNHYNTPPFQYFYPSIADDIDRCDVPVQDPRMENFLQDIITRRGPELYPLMSNPDQVSKWIVQDSLRYLATRELLDQMIEVCHQNGIRVMVFRVSTAWLTYRKFMKATPGSPQSMSDFTRTVFPEPDNLDRLLARRCKTKNVPYLSTLDLWKAPRDFYYWRYEPHLNVAGHQALAESLQPTIQKLLEEEKINPPLRQSPRP